MLQRKIQGTLAAWKNEPNHKPLIIKGCRQCGKTFSVLEFARENYAHVVYLNFFQNADYAAVFNGSLEVDHLIMMMSALLGPDAVFEPGKTVIILPLEKEMATHPSTLAWEIPWMEKPGRLQSMGSQRVGHD